MEYRGSSVMEHYYPPLFHLLPLRSFSAFKLSKDLNPAICLFTSKPNFYFTNEQLSSITILHAWYMHMNIYIHVSLIYKKISSPFHPSLSLSTKTNPVKWWKLFSSGRKLFRKTVFCYLKPKKKKKSFLTQKT